MLLSALFPPAVPRTPPRNIQVYHPTPNSLNVRWEPASGRVQQYRVEYAPLTGVRPSEFVSTPPHWFHCLLDFFSNYLCACAAYKPIHSSEFHSPNLITEEKSQCVDFHSTLHYSQSYNPFLFFLTSSFISIPPCTINYEMDFYA